MMTIAEMFELFHSNLQISQKTIRKISHHYGEITSALNYKFRKSGARKKHRLLIGSLGRQTAIKEHSDLDLLFIMPQYLRKDFFVQGGQDKLLQCVSKAINERYRDSQIHLDTLIIKFWIKNLKIEVQPVFRANNGQFEYPHTKQDGKWKYINPRPELDGIREKNRGTNKNLMRICRMTRAWKYEHDVEINGLLIDSLVNLFIDENSNIKNKNYSHYGSIFRDFFKFVSMFQTSQKNLKAFESGQKVTFNNSIQKNARKAYNLSVEALNKYYIEDQAEIWQEIFGPEFPDPT